MGSNFHVNRTTLLCLQDSIGMAMIYNLVTAAQEWLAARVAAGPSGSGLDPEVEAKRRREEEVRSEACLVRVTCVA